MPADDPDDLQRIGLGEIGNNEPIRPPKAISFIFHIRPPMADSRRPLFIGDREANMNDEYEYLNNAAYYIAPDAHLDPTDAQYRAKLERIVHNLQPQVGGTWTVEPREFDVYTLTDISK